MYYFSTYLLVDDGEAARFGMMLNDYIICSTWSDQNTNGTNDLAPGSCSAVVHVVTGNMDSTKQYNN